MTINTGISWTDHTINFWMGCLKVSEGCKFCYMYREQSRRKKEPANVVQVKQSTIDKHLREAKPGDKIFTCSYSDFFIEEADQWREWAWDIIRKHPQYEWQILTKRPERIKQCLPDDWGDGWPHVWLGVSAENQKAAETRIPILNDIPAAVRWLSCEPLLGPVNLDGMLSNIHWIVVGGESGNENGQWRYRPCQLVWIYRIIGSSDWYNIPVFVKQLGTHLSKGLSLKDRHGTKPAEWPTAMKRQEFPNTNR